MLVLGERTPLYVPLLHLFTVNRITYAVDTEAPNWIAIEDDGRELLEPILHHSQGSPIRFGELVTRHAARRQLEAGKAWLHVHDFLRSLDRAGMLSDAPFRRPPYPGRAALIAPSGLRELWIQINNAWDDRLARQDQQRLAQSLEAVGVGDWV